MAGMLIAIVRKDMVGIRADEEDRGPDQGLMEMSRCMIVNATVIASETENCGIGNANVIATGTETGIEILGRVRYPRVNVCRPYFWFEAVMTQLRLGLLMLPG